MENELKRKYQYGWYGKSEGECKPFYLNQFNDRDKIESIIRVSVADLVRLKNLPHTMNLNFHGSIIYQAMNRLMITLIHNLNIWSVVWVIW